MRVSLKMIERFVDIKTPLEDLIPRISMQIAPVEEVIDLEKKYENIVIAKIIEVTKHPRSEKLGIYKIDIADGRLIQVVAGDITLKPNDTVAYFKVGAILPYNANPEKFNGVVGKATLGGVESEGMMASERELDLGPDHSHVLVLPSNFEAGTALSKALNLDDIIIEIENKALANRGDCFGIIGIAREIAALQKIPFKSPDWYITPTKPKTEGKLPLSVINQAQANCPRYMAAVLDKVKIKPSPLWLQVELVKSGIRPVNNIVDITNYMMQITSQPMHAFDYDKVIKNDPRKSPVMVIRPGKSGESLHAINGKTIDLDDSMTVICDSKNPIGIGGIMGGTSTEIDENTTRVIFECANFNRYNIRRTSWKVGIFSDAATRFTKALDANQCEGVLYEAIRIAKEISGAVLASEIIDDYQVKQEYKEIGIDPEHLNTILATELSNKEIEEILSGIEYKVTQKENLLYVTPPMSRMDIEIPEDVYEDIARIHGFTNVNIKLPTRSIIPASRNKMYEFKNKIRETLAKQGVNEILTYSFVGDRLFKDCNLNIEDAFHIKNSLSPDLEYMRTSLVPSLLEKTSENLNKGYLDFALFEINDVHNNKELDSEKLPLERWLVSLVNVSTEEQTNPFYDVKTQITALSKSLNLKTLKFTLIADSNLKNTPIWISHILGTYNTNSSAFVSYVIDGKEYIIGIAGELSNRVKNAFDLPKGIAAFELDILSLYDARSQGTIYSEPSRFPKITQDLCFIFEKSTPFGAIDSEIERILQTSKHYYEKEVLDIYSSEKDKDRKQITFRISLQSRDKTLEGKEYDKIKKKIEYVLKEKFNAEII